MKATAVPLTAALLALSLAGCGGGNYRPVSDLPVRIGKPYQVRGVTYVPAEDPTYDVLGYAGWYGSESGNRTALGERFRPKWPSAAHPTLPLPTYLEVTALDTGRTVLVRVNDRGPFDLLGMRGQGVAPVRVRRVEPPEPVRARLRSGKPAVPGPRLSETALANLRAQLAAGVVAGLVQAQ